MKSYRIRTYKAAEGEITDAAMVKVVVLMRDLGNRLMGVMTLLFRELLCQVFKRMERLEQYRK